MKPHIYQHPRKPEATVEAILDVIAGCHGIMGRFITKLRLRTQRHSGTNWIVEPFLGFAPFADDGTPQIEICGTELRVGGETIGVREIIKRLTNGDPKKALKLLTDLGFHEPELNRFCCFETEHDRSIEADAGEAMALLDAPLDQPVRGIIIQCESIELARQLAGQAATRRKFNWHPDVPRTASGRLATVEWHGAALTDRERTLQSAMAEAANREDRAAAEKKLERLRQELRL